MGALSERTPPPRLLLALGLVSAALAGLNLWLGLGYGSPPWPWIVSSVAVGVSFAGAGMAAAWLRPRTRTGPWMLVMGVTVLLANLTSALGLPTTMPGREMTVLLGVPAFWLQFPIAGHLILGYPTGRLHHRAERTLVRVGFFLALLATVIILVTKTPVPFCADWCGRSPLQLVDDPQLYLEVRSAFLAVVAALAGVALVLLVRRFLQATPRQHRILRFMIVPTVLTILLFAGSTVITAVAYSDRSSTKPLPLFAAMGWMLFIAVPISFLAGLLSERLAFASVADLVGALEHVAADEVETALAKTLRDPTLRVVFPAEDGWIDASGRPYKPPGDSENKTMTTLGDPPLAAFVHDRSLDEDRKLLDAAAAATRLSLDNARLHAEVRAQLAEVRASRRRITAAADAERQRLERDLHDGAQQRLLGIGFALGALRGRLGESPNRVLVDELEQELRSAIRELRDIAQGIRPSILTDQGLVPALASLARRAATHVVLDLQISGRFSPITEATAYYLVSEALQNVVKHASGVPACVRVIHEADRLVIEVSDNGPGGASLTSGTGLPGLADRVDAVGGTLDIRSFPGCGTLLRAELPCG
ncbi:histidine kinase [Streptomyces sp. NPDC007369]|uniref:sensor histidine kinase n=1 Tax=Streptomyces sp. NPDC007369 TaxID=3154589 RepID=UPI0033D0C861